MLRFVKAASKPSRRGVPFVPAVLSMAWLLSGFCHAALAAPPQMPPSFDEATVKSLINKIDQEPNAIILKMGYFAVRKPHQFPRESGYALLGSSVKTATPNSRRWFVLQSVRAFAATRLRPIEVATGMEIYEDLFSRSSAAVKGVATDVVQRAVYECVVTIPMQYVDTGLAIPEAKETIVKALEAHLMYPTDYSAARPPWEKAVKKTDSYQECEALVEQTLKRRATPDQYTTLVAAAAFYLPFKPERTAELLQKAQTLSSSNTTKEPDLRLDDQVELAAVLVALYEKDKAANKKHGDQALDILSKYLAATTPRKVERELEARLMLARLFLDNKNVSEAKVVLSIEHLQDSLKTKRAHQRYADAKRLLDDLSKKQEGK